MLTPPSTLSPPESFTSLSHDPNGTGFYEAISLGASLLQDFSGVLETEPLDPMQTLEPLTDSPPGSIDQTHTVSHSLPPPLMRNRPIAPRSKPSTLPLCVTTHPQLDNQKSLPRKRRTENQKNYSSQHRTRKNYVIQKLKESLQRKQAALSPSQKQQTFDYVPPIESENSEVHRFVFCLGHAAQNVHDKLCDFYKNAAANSKRMMNNPEIHKRTASNRISAFFSHQKQKDYLAILQELDRRLTLILETQPSSQPVVLGHATTQPLLQELQSSAVEPRSPI
jgi:hypothetical protein